MLPAPPYSNSQKTGAGFRIVDIKSTILHKPIKICYYNTLIFKNDLGRCFHGLSSKTLD